MSDRIGSQGINKRALDEQSTSTVEPRSSKRHKADTNASFFADTTTDAARAHQEYQPGSPEEEDDTAQQTAAPQLHMRSTAVIWKQQRGWWPTQYAPDDPNCPTIRTNMKAIIRKFIRAGLDPQEMWSEEGEGGCMVKAIRESQKGVVTGRLFKKVKLPTGLQPRKNENGNARPTIQEPTGPYARVESPTTLFPVSSSNSLTRRDKDEPAPHCTHHSIPITQSIQQINEAHSFWDSWQRRLPEGAIDPLGTTISRLKENGHLASIDIWRLVKLLNIQDDTHVFEPGFPSETSPLSPCQFLATQFIFFIHSGQHWSLGHLDISAQRLCHYNSAQGIDINTEDLEYWVCRQFGLGFVYGDGIIEKESPQQMDGFDSGIVALHVLIYLIQKREVPKESDTKQLRRAFAICLQQQRELGSNHSWQSQLFPSPSHELRVNQEPSKTLLSIPTDRSSAMERNLPSTDQASSNAMKGYFTTFRDSFIRAEKNEILAARESKLSSSQFELKVLGEKLKTDVRTAKELEKQIDISISHKWLSQWPDRNEEKNFWVDELLSHVQSNIGGAEVKDRLLHTELQSFRAACDQGWRDIARVEKVVQTEKMLRDDLMASIKMAKDVLDDMKLACGEIGNGGA